MSQEILAISPIDGRYKTITYPLQLYFSEYALFKYRLMIEIEYFIKLSKILPELSDFNIENIEILRDIYINFSIEDCLKIKEKEVTTNHDIKALEYFIQEKFLNLGIDKYNSFIHFALTSQDINSSAQMLAIKDGLENSIIPEIKKIISILDSLSILWKNISMLSKTHGQVATPTTVGKELQVFVYRLKNEITNLNKSIFYTKFGGAVGNFSAHFAAYPQINWIEFADKFVNDLGLVRHKYTTQISNYDEISFIIDSLKRINSIILDLNQDMWLYISYGYFKQKIIKNEVGSSTMPHKINPINFENSEGNLIVANSLIEGISRKIPISRLQRDLTDSTILRNVGSLFAYSLIGYTSTIKGLNKLELNETVIKKDLNQNYVVLSEALQTILRRESIDNSYELFKDFTRTDKIFTENNFLVFINSLDIKENIKKELISILKTYSNILTKNF